MHIEVLLPSGWVTCRLLQGGGGYRVSMRVFVAGDDGRPSLRSVTMRLPRGTLMRARAKGEEWV
jgi:hypothetical protein